ncbi:MAG: hypothetical protein K6G65_05945 [Lachnospiraceae bacterium]|nr:hypothetical protein [Lachnospiraceae bacterium]
MKELDYDLYFSSPVKALNSYVSDECDKLEFTGSSMFDDIPDRVFVNSVADTVYNNYRKVPPGTKPCPPSFCPNQGRCPVPRPDFDVTGAPDWLHSLITILVLNEMGNRRKRYENFHHTLDKHK